MKAIIIVAVFVVVSMACRLASPTIPSPTQDATITVKPAVTFHSIAIPSTTLPSSTSTQHATSTVTVTFIPATTTPSPTPFLSPSKQNLTSTADILPSLTPVALTMTRKLVSPTPALSPTKQAVISKTIVGAIRWDGWVGDTPTFGNTTGDDRVGLVVERTLGPAHWHYRLPFFAVKLNKDTVQVRGNTEKIIDQEIRYAAEAGLDYWAFNYYSPGTGLDAALNLYLNSPDRNTIKFSLILGPGDYLLRPETRQILTDYFQMSNYQTVLDGRPLVYILGNSSLTKEVVENLRASGKTTNDLEPYLVYLGWSARQVKAAIKKYRLDAGSAYAQRGGGGQPFANLAGEAEKGWDSYRLGGIKVIPWVTTGWDPRPRIENSTPWINYPENEWTQPAKPIEIAKHLKNALKWNAAYPDTAETNAILIYAWNEFDEGGWLCPTLYSGTNRLDTIKKIWNKK